MDLCFLCTNDLNCVCVNDNIVSQVKYLLPQITIIKLGITLRICSGCEGVLRTFSKFKQTSLVSSRRLETSIKGASAHVADNSNIQLLQMEETFYKEHLVPIVLLTQLPFAEIQPQRVSAEPDNQLHKDTTSQNVLQIEEAFNKEHLHTEEKECNSEPAIQIEDSLSHSELDSDHSENINQHKKNSAVTEFQCNM